jgi:aldehyde oxidoreductase
MIKKHLNINGQDRYLLGTPGTSLFEVLQGNMEGSLHAPCQKGVCGTCAVILNSSFQRACQIPLEDVPHGSYITTVESLQNPGVNQAIHLGMSVHNFSPCPRCARNYFKVLGELLLKSQENVYPAEVPASLKNRVKSLCCGEYEQVAKVFQDSLGLLYGQITSWELGNKRYLLRNTYLGEVSKQNRKGCASWRSGLRMGIGLPPGTLHLALIYSNISGFREDPFIMPEVERMPGVFAILTHHDVKGRNSLCCPGVFSHHMDEASMPLLFDGKREGGNIVAIICGVTEFHAVKYADRVVESLEKTYSFKGLRVNPSLGSVHETEKICEGFACLDSRGKIMIYSKIADLPPHRLSIALAIGVNWQDIILLQPKPLNTPGCPKSLVLSAILGASLLATGRPVFLKHICSVEEHAKLLEK